MCKVKNSFLAIVSFIFVIDQSLFSQNIKISQDSLVTIIENDGAFYNKHPLKPMLIMECVATSFLETDTKSYPVRNLIDKNDNTAWVEGSPSGGIGEVIRVTFKNKNLPYVIRIIPGYIKSKKSWDHNNRVATINIRTIGVEEEDKEYVIDEWKQVSFRKDSLTKVAMSPQYIDISQNYFQHMGYNDFIAIEIEIMEVDDIGAVYNDTCISEISFYNIGELIKAYTPE